MGKETGELRQEIDETRDRMGDTVDAIAYKADVPSRMHDALNDRVDSMKSAITGTVGNLRHGIGGATSRVGDALPNTSDVRDAASTTVRAVRENPLGLFFGTAAIGFLLGSLMPVTEIENERLGEIGDQVKRTAHDAGDQLLEQGKAVVRETVDAATQSAKTHGQEVVRTVSSGMSQSGTNATSGF